MLSFFTRLAARAPTRDQKSSRTAALFGTGHAHARPPRALGELVRHGYERNPIVFRSVRMVAETVASVPWVAYVRGQEEPDHPALALMRAPNAAQSGAALLETLAANLLLFGNAYLEAVALDGELREVHALRPDRISVAPGANGWPAAYDYSVGGQRIRFMAADNALLHMKLYSPLDDHYGASPLAAAEIALDTHNAAAHWNRALLENAARPSGALVYAGPDGASLSDEQFERLKAELDENFTGARNAGRPLLLEGGLDWKALSLSPKDMDFIEAKASAARDIALALGVPPLVLGLPGDNTYANYQEANRAFWRQTIIPFVLRLQASVQAWLRPAFGEFDLRPDLDRIDALAEERSAEWARIGAATFLTESEKREAVGYGPARP